MRPICYYITFLFFVYYTIGFGQSETISQENIYDSPRFNNQGIDNFKLYIQNNLVYPEEAAILDLEGKTFYKFLIDFSMSPSGRVGVVDSLQIVKSLNPVLDSIGFNIIKDSKEWTTAFARGKGVNTWIVIPVSYSEPDTPEYYHINKFNGKYYLNSSEEVYNRDYSIQNTFINGLLNILPISPSFKETCNIVFSVNEEGYIVEFEIKDNENVQFKSFISTYVYSLPKINTEIQQYLKNDSRLQISLKFEEKNVSISQVGVVIEDHSVSNDSQFKYSFKWKVPQNIFDLINQSDSATVKTIFEYENQLIQEIIIYESYDKNKIKSIKQVKLTNSNITNVETKFIYREYSSSLTDYDEYIIIYDTLNPSIKLNKIETYMKKAKMPPNAKAFVRTKIMFDINKDTVRTYKYFSKIRTDGEWLPTSNSYSTSLKNGRLIEEGFQFTSGLFETQLGNNSDKLNYYNNNNIVTRMIKRNEGTKTIVYFKDNNKTTVFRIEDIYNDFSDVINPNMTINSFESYLLNNNSIFYKSIQLSDGSNRLLKEKYFHKRYFGTMQIDRMIDYQYINNSN